MITYSKEAQKSYIENIERLQKVIGEIPEESLGYTDAHWLIHTALEDLKAQVKKEHK